MTTYIITVKAENDIDRLLIENFSLRVFKNKKELIDAIEETGAIYKIYTLDDFIDAWNDTDDDMEVLNISQYFLGHCKIED